MLEPLGLNETTETVYRAILSAPGTTVPELAQMLSLDEQQLRASLDELGQRCLVRASWSTPDVLRPVRPDVALEALLAQERAELARRQQQIEEGQAAIATLAAEYAGQQAAATRAVWAERLDGVEAVRRRLEELTSTVRYEVLSVMGEGAETPLALESSKPLDEALLDRGVEVRSMYRDSVRNDPHTAAYARWLTQLGGQVRTCPILPPRMIIVDRTVAVLPSNPDKTEAGAVQVTSPGIVAALTAFYDQLWESAQVLGTPQQVDSRGLKAQQRQLLRLLYQGNTDEAAAQKLGVSVRTARRIAADLMTATGARSRFQLAVRVQERGWLRFGD
jgi:sugar-specific transcriptional regulator TrmB/DNA-binding CsgD family transcriptional regulator